MTLSHDSQLKYNELKASKYIINQHELACSTISNMIIELLGDKLKSQKFDDELSTQQYYEEVLNIPLTASYQISKLAELSMELEEDGINIDAKINALLRDSSVMLSKMSANMFIRLCLDIVISAIFEDSGLTVELNNVDNYVNSNMNVDVTIKEYGSIEEIIYAHHAINPDGNGAIFDALGDIPEDLSLQLIEDVNNYASQLIKD